MKTQLTMIKDGAVLRPHGDYAWEVWDGLSTRKPVVVTIHQPRNPEHSALFWLVASHVAKFDDSFEDAQDAVTWAKMQMPYMWKEFRDFNNRMCVVLESTSPESMDQIAFKRFFDRTLHVWAKRIGVDPMSLLPKKEES